MYKKAGVVTNCAIPGRTKSLKDGGSSVRRNKEGSMQHNTLCI